MRHVSLIFFDYLVSFHYFTKLISKFFYANGAIDGNWTRGQRIHKPLLYHWATIAIMRTGTYRDLVQKCN